MFETFLRWRINLVPGYCETFLRLSLLSRAAPNKLYLLLGDDRCYFHVKGGHRALQQPSHAHFYFHLMAYILFIFVFSLSWALAIGWWEVDSNKYHVGAILSAVKTLRSPVLLKPSGVHGHWTCRWETRWIGNVWSTKWGDKTFCTPVISSWKSTEEGTGPECLFLGAQSEDNNVAR